MTFPVRKVFVSLHRGPRKSNPTTGKEVWKKEKKAQTEKENCLIGFLEICVTNSLITKVHFTCYITVLILTHSQMKKI